MAKITKTRILILAKSLGSLELNQNQRKRLPVNAAFENFQTKEECTPACVMQSGREPVSPP